MKLSILDQAPISAEKTAQEALNDMVLSAELADELGFHRFWIAEHHNTIGLASSAPEVSIAYLAARTKNIRLGSGGTMMMHYSPYKMAELFKTLSAYAPGRIDFGGGRAPGGDSKSIFALSEGRDPLVYGLYEKFYDTLKLLNDEDGDNPLYQNIIAQPTQIQLPQAFLLGSSGSSAEQAGNMGAAYAYVQFFNGHIDASVFDIYRSSFRPSAFHEKPHVLACYFVTVAETAEEAHYQGLSADISRMLLHRGKQIKRLSPQEAHDYPLSLNDRMMIAQMANWHIKGSIAEVTQRLLSEQQRHGFDELMICTIPYDIDFKLNSYRMLAKQFI